MTVCAPIRFKHRGICAGDLDRKIIIKSREISAPSAGVDFGLSFETEKTVWAALKTVKGRETFFVTNMDIAVSHIFYVRWFDGLTADMWVEYRDENYDILEVDNLDERNEFAALLCNVRGDDTKAVNSA